MIWVKFGKWSTAAMSVFYYKRVYFKGFWIFRTFRWTPFVIVTRRKHK